MTSSAATWVSAKWNRDDDKCGGGWQEAGWQTWRTAVTGRRGKGGGKEDMSVLPGSQVKLVCRKLKWHGGDSDRCSLGWGLKRVQGAETHANRHMLCTQPSGAFFWTPRDKIWEKMGWGGDDMKLISHPINVTDDTQHNISACRDPRGPWEMNICPIDLSHLIQS